MDLETINTMTNTGQQYLQDGLSLIGWASSAKQINDFLRQKAPFLYSDCKFWGNMDKFFNGGILSYDDKQKLIEKLSDIKNNYENEKRFLDLISKVDTDKKLVYILNATNALLNDKITLSIYFRICHVVINTLEEDLQFLKAHVNDEKIPYSVEVGGLITAGLAYHTGVDDDNIPRYSFTELAKLIHNCTITNEISNRIEDFNLNEPSQNVFFTTHSPITKEDIQSIFDGTYQVSQKIKN